jgi:membrane-associated phospholipid phosphatase
MASSVLFASTHAGTASDVHVGDVAMIAHEFPKTWVKILPYGAAVSVLGARLRGPNHFPSDVWVGSLLGYFISSHIFHAHCEPGLSEACRRE